MEASGHQLERILDELLDRVLIFSVKRGASSGDAKIIVLYWFLQCLLSVDLFTKKHKMINVSSKTCVFFGRVVGTTFSSILVDFCLHLGRVLGAQIGKNTFRRGSKKQSKKKSCG